MQHIDDLREKQERPAVPTFMFTKASSVPIRKPRVPVTINDALVLGSKRKERPAPLYMDANVVQPEKKQMVPTPTNSFAL